jgi:hypothetical protein
VNKNIDNMQSNVNDASLTGIGYLIVKVSTAAEAIPIEAARVSIFDNEDSNKILYSLLTDSAGLTEQVSIPTVSASESQAPGNNKPYATVNVEVAFSGYSPVRFSNVPIFDNIVSVQRANMVPLSENGENYIYDFNEWSNYLTTPNNL